MVRRNTRRRNRRMRGGSNLSDAVNKQYSASCLKNQTNAFTGPKGVAGIPAAIFGKTVDGLQEAAQ